MSKNKNIKILVCYHKKDKLFKNNVLVPIHCGRKLACQASKDGKISKKDYQWLLDNMIGDDTGENISELNREVNEMSAIYWAWKNYDKLGNPDYIGLCHYRRLFDFSYIIKTPLFNYLDNLGLNEKCLNKLLKNYDFVYREGFKIKDNNLHTFEPYQVNVNLSESYHQLLFEEYIKFKKEQIFYCNSMFIMKKEDFFSYCEEIFTLMFDFLNKPKNEINNKFLNWHKENHSKYYEEALNNSKKNNNYHPRLTGYMMEYISCFYFMYLREKYKERALPGSIVTLYKKTLSKKILNFIFFIENKYINNKKYKHITLVGLKFKIPVKNKFVQNYVEKCQ